MDTKDASERYKHTDKIAVVSATYYNPKSIDYLIRSELAKDTIKKACDLGHQVFIVDGGSCDAILKEFERYGAKVYAQESPGMGASRRQAIREAQASGKEVLAWVEPEKLDYISKIADTANPILKGKADIVIPRRISMSSYPTAQQFSEPFGNAFWKELTGTDRDMFFGPRTWHRDMSNYFLDYPGTYGDKWDAIFLPVMNAIIEGKRIVSQDCDYTHPPKQTAIEENNLGFYHKRIEQLDNLMNALEKHWKDVGQK